MADDPNLLNDAAGAFANAFAAGVGMVLGKKFGETAADRELDYNYYFEQRQ